MPTIETADGARLFYNDWGTGRPIVLIHGWPLNADMWEYQAPCLAAHGFRVIAYDRRGFGRSSQSWTGYDYDTLADDLAAVIDTLDLQGVTLAGFSMSGGEIARYLARHGAARIAKAALISTVLPCLLETEANPDGVPRAIFDKMQEGLRDDRPGFLATFGKQFFGVGLLNFKVSSELLQWTSSLAMQASPKATYDCVTAFSSTDFRQDIAAITVPTLIIHGGSDALVPFEHSSERTKAMLPAAKLIVYDGAPHGLFFTDKDRLNADLLAFAG